jgi:hypothetical protein
MPKGVVRKRLKDIYPKDTHIAEGLCEDQEQWKGDLAKPTYLS